MDKEERSRVMISTTSGFEKGKLVNVYHKGFGTMTLVSQEDNDEFMETLMKLSLESTGVPLELLGYKSDLNK